MLMYLNIFSYCCHILYRKKRTLAWWLECSPLAWETWVQSQVEAYQRLKKWYSMPLCLTLNCTFAIYTHLLMMALEEHQSTWEPVKYGKFVSQFLLDIKTTIQQFERIETKICRQRLSVIFNQICLNEEMPPKYTLTHTHTYIYIYIYIWLCVCVCAYIYIYIYIVLIF